MAVTMTKVRTWTKCNWIIDQGWIKNVIILVNWPFINKIGTKIFQLKWMIGQEHNHWPSSAHCPSMDNWSRRELFAMFGSMIKLSFRIIGQDQIIAKWIISQDRIAKLGSFLDPKSIHPLMTKISVRTFDVADTYRVLIGCLFLMDF